MTAASKSGRFRLGRLLHLLDAQASEKLNQSAAIAISLQVCLAELIDMIRGLRCRKSEAVGRLCRTPAPLLAPGITAERAAQVTAIDNDFRLRNSDLLIRRRRRDAAPRHDAAAEDRHVALNDRTDAARIGDLFGERARHQHRDHLMDARCRVFDIIQEEESGLKNGCTFLFVGEAMHLARYDRRCKLDLPFLPFEPKARLPSNRELREVLDARA